MRVLYIKNRVVVNIVEHDVLPTSVQEADYAIEDFGANVGEPCEIPYVLAEIQAEESKQARALRETVLTGDKTRLKAIDDRIAGLRRKLGA